MNNAIKKLAALAAVCAMSCSALSALAVSAAEITLGDINGDGDINVTDISICAAHVKSIRNIADDRLAAADVNKDDDVNVTDLNLIAAHVKGIRNIPEADKQEPDEDGDFGQAAFTKAMGLGWNLGNTYEAVKSNGKEYTDVDGQGVKYSSGETVYEVTPDPTAWGNIPMNADLAKQIKELGFSSVRMPVGWLDNIGEGPDYKIKDEWMSQIKEAVDYMVAEDLYVIVNMHSDGYHTIAGGWLYCDAPEEQQEVIRAKYAAVWTQIAETFKDYDEHVIFESMNEEFARKRSAEYRNFTNDENDSNWGDPDAESYENINKYNQIFVDSIRAVGGENSTRWLLVPGWNTNIEYTEGDYGFRIPTDEGCTAESNRIAISVHYYDPYNFVLNEDTRVTQWGPEFTNKAKVDTTGAVNALKKQMARLKTFTDAGYPVIIGEFSPTDKTYADPDNTEFRRVWCENVVKYAKENGAIPVYWDNGAKGKGGCRLFNRRTGAVDYPTILEGMLRAINTEGDYEIPKVVPYEEEVEDPDAPAEIVTATARLGFADTDWDPMTNIGADENEGIPSVDTTLVSGANELVFSGFSGKTPEGATVFVIDIIDAADKLKDLKISDVKVFVDGTEIAVDQSKLAMGDLEGKNNYRIEIYNAYGNTKNASPIDVSKIKAANELKVTFNAESKHLAAAE
ncbi:cellulase family glycosylhydrolase [Ruminococcus sp.]|uniref:cellulase family glycosylhydrolase n=1 Tax=Ruminococcus sp. TaxID=41978 RepID=UPI0025CBF356|nr:cellulase family glycosylhydrolase [Ruminococcus sp.]MBQ8967851.1 cellulase family glycosylhydrolase [Ruminococcus sp.]